MIRYRQFQQFMGLYPVSSVTSEEETQRETAHDTSQRIDGHCLQLGEVGLDMYGSPSTGIPMSISFF